MGVDAGSLLLSRRLIRILRIGLGTGHLLVAVAPTLLLAGADKTCRRLRLRASADGHDRASRMRRTARFDALLRYLVKDDDDCERLASAGAMQKSISFTFPRGVVFCSMSAPGVEGRSVLERLWVRLIDGAIKARVKHADHSMKKSVEFNLMAIESPG
jgi:hypothetical protein